MQDWTFPDESTYRTRVAAVQEALRGAGLDVLVTSGADTRRFLGGVDGLAHIRPIWLVVPAAGDPVFVSPRLETEEIQAQSWIPVTHEWMEWDDGLGTPQRHVDALFACLVDTMGGAPGRIGVDFYQSSAASVDLLREEFGAESIEDASSLLLTVRLVKDTAVIDVVRRCADIAAHQYAAVREALRPGMTEWELARVSRDAGIARGGHWWGTNEAHSPLIPGVHILSSGASRASRAHSVASGRVIEDGDIVEVCFCGIPFFGHSVGFDRPLIAGSKPITDAARDVIRTAEEAQAAALAAVRPGNTAGDVHAAAFGVIERKGWVGALRHRTGRGLGSAEVEYPELKASDPTPLRPGMIFAIEPGIYLKDVAGVRFGDTVVVTETGYEALTPITEGHDV
jgi:Xaa-Pro dipeptidase